MRKIRNITRDERINFKKLIPLFLLILATLSPLRVAKAGVIQDIGNAIKYGLYPWPCTVGLEDKYCSSSIYYYPGLFKLFEKFKISSHLEEDIPMKQKGLLLLTKHYYGVGKLEPLSTRYDLYDSKGKKKGSVHGHAIVTLSRRIMEDWKKDSSRKNIPAEEMSFFASKFKVKDCKIQTGSNSCASTILVSMPKAFERKMTLKTEDGEEIEMQRNGLLDYLSIVVRTFVGYGQTKHTGSTFTLYDDSGKIMNVGTAKATCQDDKATMDEEGYCIVEGEEDEAEDESVKGENSEIVYTASPSTCLIKEGKSSCDVLFKWDLTNLVHNYNTRMTSSYIEIYKMISGVEAGSKEMIKKSFNSSKPYGSKPLAISYPGGSYALSVRHKGKVETLDSLVVRAECEPETKWDGKKCVRYETMGEIKPEFSHCEIEDGSNSCTVELSWSTIDPDPLKESKVMAGSKVIAEANMGNETVSVSYPYSVYNLEHKKKLLGTAYANSYCKAGAIWDGNKCERKVDPEEDDLMVRHPDSIYLFIAG